MCADQYAQHADIVQAAISMMVTALRGLRRGSDGLRYVDLRENLENVPGSYRKLDGHWSHKGEAIEPTGLRSN